MKFMTISMTCCLILASTNAQSLKGRTELSLAGTFGSTTTKSEVSTPFGSSTNESDAQGFFIISLRPGFFVAGGLEIEPEILMTAAKGSPPVFNFIGNVAYNFMITESTIMPFLAAGYGVGNGIPLNGTLLFRSSSDLDVNVLTFGGGAKFFVSPGAAFRAEYRYQSYSQETSSSSFGGTFTSKMTRSSHDFFLGFSVFLGNSQ